jgi:UDP-N-acetylglucosamine 2-epimerase (non-hydrolysing)
MLNKKIIHLIAAARPNFMKIAPLYHILKHENWITPIIVHTGQHYDPNMSGNFFQDLGLPEPHIHLNVGSGTHAEQTGKVLIAYEKVLIENGPDLVVVVGDVNSTVAATIAAVKLGIKVAHLEAGLRSFDRTMPEEINRIITDSIADILWTPSPDGDENLLREGISPDKIQLVGNIMIDSLEMMRSKIERENTCNKYGLTPAQYGLITLHRPANVDEPSFLTKICNTIQRVSEKITLVFPVHPRTRKNLNSFGLLNKLESSYPNIRLAEPISYIPFMNLVFNSKFVLTDSGGIQEETTYLGIPCFTLRPNTERPITVTQGTNNLCNIQDVESIIDSLLKKNSRKGNIPELWDGHTSERVLKSIKDFLF